MRAFEHVDATSPGEAIALLAADPTARAIAGGTDLIPEMRLGIREPGRLVNLKAIEGLDQIRAENGFLRIGALARLADVAAHDLIRSRWPILAEAIGLAASPQIRNVATLGGSLCQESRCWYFRGPFHCWLKGGTCCDAERGDNRYHAIFGGGPCFTAHPSDTATVLTALGATATILGPRGERTISLDEFFTLPRDSHRALTSLAPAELLLHLDLPWPAGEQAIFRKAMDRAEFGFAVASVAAVITLDREQVVAARIVLGGVAPIPWRAAAVEQAMIGCRFDAATIERASVVATQGAAPLSRNSYKLPLVRGLVRQALRQLADRNGSSPAPNP